MKKILRSILVCAAMIITFSWNTNCVKAEDSIEIYNGVKYRVNNEQKWASVCGYSGDAEDLEIPFMVGRGIIVSQIDDHAFDGCSSVKILTIPDTIVKVGDMSFIGMDNLQAVISTARGINIVVRDNVKIVKDRSQLDNSDNDDGGSSDNNNNSSNNTSSDSGQGNPGVNNTPDGTGVRDYIHVVDLAIGHVKAIERMKKAKGVHIYNLGTGKGYSVLDIVKNFEAATGIKIPYSIKPRRAGDVATCYSDATKAKKELGWEAEYDIKDMCADSWNFQQKNPNGYED